MGTRITRHRGDHRARVRIEGALDLATRDRFLAEVGAALDGADGLELDLRELDYIDSVGLAAILEASRRAERDTLQKARLLIAETGPVRRMLELTLLHLTLDIRVG